ncbi:MAG TPA: hypothetical protein DHW82_01610 [Spirochaetia bacterium]|nr:MAG: hypothetical protein A2Y41_00925 [Spirochaetes bacterium GWB1_36_13]HCL55692.1 hypothetical protein [Spirochaetia bacterium]
MLQEMNKLYQKMLNDWTQAAQPVWFDFLKSEPFLKWMKLFHIYFFDAKEKTNEMMEKTLEMTRIASKEDIKDLVDAQRLMIDMMEELTDRLNKIENKNK